MMFSDSNLVNMSFEGPSKMGGLLLIRVRSFAIRSFHLSKCYNSKGICTYHAERWPPSVSFPDARWYPYKFYTFRPIHNWRFSFWHVVDTGTGNNPSYCNRCQSLVGWNFVTQVRSFFLWLKRDYKYWKHERRVHPRLIDKITCPELLLFKDCEKKYVRSICTVTSKDIEKSIIIMAHAARRIASEQKRWFFVSCPSTYGAIWTFFFEIWHDKIAFNWAWCWNCVQDHSGFELLISDPAWHCCIT